MTTSRPVAVAITLAIGVTSTLAQTPKPPRAAKKPVSHTLHGETRIDEYAWLRDRSDPQTIAYLEAENAYMERSMAHTTALRDALYAEFVGRLKQTDLTVPYPDGPYEYYSRTVEGLAYPIHCRRRDGGAEEVYLDVNELADDAAYLRVTARAISPDHRMLAYATDTSGYETVNVHIKDLTTGVTREDVLTGVAPWGLTWAADGKTLFYGRTDDTKRMDRIYRHVLGAETAHDALVAREDDVRFSIDVSRTRSDDYILIASDSSTTSEVWFLDARAPGGEPRPIAGRREGVEYSVDHRRGPDGGWFYIRTDDGAPNFKLTRAAVSDPSIEGWETVIEHDPAVYITGISVFRDHFVTRERRDAATAIRVVRHDDGAEHLIELPESVGTAGPDTNAEYDTSTFRFSYTSMVTPRSIYDYDMSTRRRTLRKRQEVLGGYDPADYETYRLWTTAEDGTRIPITVVHRRGLERDGSNPCLLSGYGSYGSPSDPRFNSPAVSLLDRGYVVAIAHVRGGSEMGRHWKEDGKMLNKRNTFTDFIACAEELVAEGYTSPERLAIRGGSAGGLLIGAVLNMRPDLFAAAHAAVPFVDVINTMLDPSIPLTTSEYEEWGNPADSTAFHYIMSYSPYDNVAAQDYPAILVTAGLNDPRVHYWEPAKWTARLRDHKTDDNPLILRTNMGAGHGGASGRYDRMREQAFEYAFIVDQLQDDE